MQRVINKIKILLMVIMGFFFVQCSGNQQQSVTVTGSILGEDGAYTPATPVNLILNHNPEGNSSLRVIDSPNGIQNQKSVKLLVERTGIPLTEEYWFMNIFRLEPRLDYDNEMPAAAVGNIEWLRDHAGDLAVLGLRPDMIDSPLSDSIIFNQSTWLRLTGHSYLCRVQEDDIIIPFNDASSLLDISRLTSSISNAFGNIVTTAVNTTPILTLGGSDGAGDFRMYFVPHVLHSTLSVQRNIKGVGFIFRFTANITVGINITEFMVYIPISILMEPVIAAGGGMRYEVFLDPFSMIGGIVPPDNINRITVTASGLFDHVVATQVRNTVVDALNNVPQNDLDQLELLAGGLSALINSFRESNSNIPEDWDVILLPPRQLSGSINRNLISPAPNGLEISLLLLEK